MPGCWRSPSGERRSSSASSTPAAWRCSGFGALLFALAVLWDAFRLDAGNQIVRSFHTMWDRRPPAARPAAWWRRLRAAAALLLAAGFLIGAAVSVPMARQAYFTPPGEEPRTALVLGCQVEREGPSLMLARRLEAARRYLEAHPDAPVVVSGGYEERAGTSEAAVMAAWLIERGIDPARIHLEDRSHSTEENLAFSAEIIGREGLPRALAVATDGSTSTAPPFTPGRTGWPRRRCRRAPRGGCSPPIGCGTSSGTSRR